MAMREAKIVLVFIFKLGFRLELLVITCLALQAEQQTKPQTVDYEQIRTLYPFLRYRDFKNTFKYEDYLHQLGEFKM